MQDTIWRTRDGRLVTVSAMTTSHIRNALALMDRRPGWRSEYRDRLEIELVRRSLK